MGFNSSATVYVSNETGGHAYISFSHEYSDDGPQVWTGPILQPGGNAGPLQIGFNTGFLYTGLDYWFCVAHVLDGPSPGIYATEGSLDQPIDECECEAVDNGTTIYCPVTTENFTIALNSGPCGYQMYQQPPEALHGKLRSERKKSAAR
ncbi:hypothetical protein [Frankia tisae]|uniref:hypothetical protein n=1 Tax=Frankia tisae TaxID=2950104 RepID=UPI0021C1DB79|nr:hypothetical protein [Frankia tisae]